MRLTLLRTSAFLVGAGIALRAYAGAAPEPPTIPLTINGHKIAAEVEQVVASDAGKAKGLQGRFSLKPDHGMVFVFDRTEPLGFYMKDTYIPLSIAFIAEDGRIVNLDEMAPRSESTYWSSGPARYALEMRKGWFTERGIKAGDQVKGLPAPKR